MNNFSLLLNYEYSCVEASDDIEGGETIFCINNMSTKIVSKESVTPNHCVVFRKDINHEASLLVNGLKVILTMNLYSVPKDSEKVFIITFADSNREADDFLESNHYYCIPINNIMKFDNVLKTKVTFDPLIQIATKRLFVTTKQSVLLRVLKLSIRY